MCGIDIESANGGDAVSKMKILRSSGISEFDQNIALEHQALNTFFCCSARPPSLSLIDDSTGPIGAKALKNDGNAVQVYLGITLLKEEIRENPGSWQSNIIGTLAHEWGHVIQYQAGLDDERLNFEMHADYMAGWYMGLKSIFGSSADPVSFQKSLFLKGTPIGQFAKQEYGTPKQRVLCFTAGFEDSIKHSSSQKIIRSLDVDDAAQRGYRFIKEHQ